MVREKLTFVLSTLEVSPRARVFVLVGASGANAVQGGNKNEGDGNDDNDDDNNAIVARRKLVDTIINFILSVTI